MLIELVVQHHFLELEQPITLEELKSRITAVVPFENLRYRDDEGDEVNLSSELEWKEACSLGQNHLLEVIVTPQKTTSPQPKEETPVTTPVNENVPSTENLTLHPGISCSSCSLPVVGIRYKCSICHHYDLCETCEGLAIHQEHPFIKARKPLPENFQNVHTVTSSLHSVTQGLNQAQKTVNDSFHTAQESFNKAINQPQVQNVLTQVQEQLNKAQDQVNKFLSQPQVVAAKQQVLDTWTVFKEEAKTQMTALAEKIQEKTTELQTEVKARLEKEQQQRAANQQQQQQQSQQPPSQPPATTPSYIPQNSVPAPYPPVPSRQRYSQELATLKELNLGQSDSQLLSLLERNNGNLQYCVDELLSS